MQKTGLTNVQSFVSALWRHVPRPFFFLLTFDVVGSSLFPHGRFTSSNLTVDWVKAAEEAKAKKSKKKGENANSMVTSVTEGTGDGYSDDEPEEAEDDDEDSALFKDSRAFKGHRGGVLEPGHLDIVRRVSLGGWAAIALEHSNQKQFLCTSSTSEGLLQTV